MKIVHLDLDAPYNEGWGYQENLLTKYQVKAGHDVTLVVSNRINCEDGKQKKVELEDYISPDGFRVIRLDYLHYKPQKFSLVFKYYKIFPLLKNIQPDFIMVHGLNNFSVLQVVKYIKRENPECKVIADNHLDYNNGGYLTSKKVSIKIYRKLLCLLNKKMQKYYSKVYGVTPWRCEYAKEIYGIAEEKLDLLPAGADDEKIDYENKDKIRDDIRKKYNINNDDFLIVTGGKIDEKKNIDKLMEAVTKLPDKKVKLIVFGQCSDGVKEKVEKLAEHKSIRYIGWISSDDTYNYFLAADLVFFPGGHSVMWEQATACGVPCVFKHFDSMHHCDIGGNCKFLNNVNEESIKNIILEIIEPKTYNVMYNAANSEKRKQFLYSELAKKII